MAQTPPTPRPTTAFVLILTGGLATAPGGFGIAFRASGIGYLPQATILFLAGLSALTLGLHLARADRHAMFAPRPPSVAIRLAVQPQQQSAQQWSARPERIRVTAWTVVDQALPAGRLMPCPRSLPSPSTVAAPTPAT